MKFPYSKKRVYLKGEFVLKQGDISDDIYFIRNGLAELIEYDDKGNEVLTGVVDKGQIIGELGFILEEPRSYSVRALSDLEVDIFDTRSFSELYETELGQFLKPILQKLAERIRNNDARIAELTIANADFDEDSIEAGISLTPGAKKASTANVIFRADTEEAVTSMGGIKSLEVSSFPFEIGRFSRRRSDDMFHFNNFYLHDFPPYSVSRSHFSIIYKNGEYYLRDRGSQLGCIVNGSQIGGGHFRTKKCKLKKGKNTLIIGNSDKNLSYIIEIL